MKIGIVTVSTLVLFALALSANQIRAQSVYTPYAFTNFVGGFNNPWAIAVDSVGNVYVEDNDTEIRKITPAAEVTTLASGFHLPHGLAVDSASNVYVADSDNNTIAKMSQVGMSWVVTTIAGSGQQGTNDGIGSAAQFNNPRGVAVDNSTNIYVADFLNSTIRKITPVGTNWMVTTLAGSAGLSGTNNGIGSAVRFNFPRAVAVDNATNVYVADTSNYTVRKITPVGTNWVVTTLAGSPQQYGSADGIGSAARFLSPRGVAVDSAGNVYVAEDFSNTIRKITPTGTVTTLGGTAGQSGTNNGIGSAARFYAPQGVAVDGAGNLYVADQFNERITKGTPVLQFDNNAGIMTSNGLFWTRLDWTGPFGSNVVVDTSGNLQGWTPVQTNAIPPGCFDISVPLGTNQSQFFRARLSP